MKKKVLASVFGFFLLLAACGGGDDAANTGAEAGEQLYLNNCAVCHGSNLEGGGGPNLQNISDRYDAEGIQNVIHQGHGTMRAVNMSEEDAQTLAEWLVSQ